jgi:hypothetical protein
MTATTYTIYIINQSGTNQVFWCFEAPPQKLATNAADYVNSGAVRAVSLRQADANFEVSAQEVGTEGAGLNAEIVSDVACEASLREPIELSYLSVQLTEQPSQQASPVTYYVTIGRDITAGSDGGDVLASSDEQPTNSIAITVPDSFQDQSCTVSYDAPGRWSQSPGAPLLVQP